MQTAPLQISVRALGTAAVWDMAGDIDRNAAVAMQDAYRVVSAQGRIVLNFTEVGYINSTGIAVIVGFIGWARADNRSVAAYGLTPHYAQIFEITRLSDFIEIHQNEAAATAAH